MKINQCAMVLNHMMMHGSITKRQANTMGIRNLSARISQLRRLGMAIENGTREGYRLSWRTGLVTGRRNPETEELNLFTDERND